MKRVKSFGPNSFKPKMKGGMPRMKKFEEGGDVEVGEGFSAAMNAGASSSRRQDDEPVAKPKSQSFSDAFREARKAGLKTFKWNGGTYGTMLKGEDGGKEVKPAASAASAPSAPPRPAPAPSSPSSPSTTRSGPVRGRGLPGTREIDRQYQANRRASYGDRVLSPFITALGSDSFDFRREEDVMRRMNVDRAEARKRLAKLDEVEERENKAPGITQQERDSSKLAGAALGTAATAGVGALGAGTAAGLGALRGAATAAPAVARAATRSATSRAIGSGRAAASEAPARSATSRAIRPNRPEPPRKSKKIGSARNDMAAGGSVKAFAKGGSVRGGGCETKGKTKGRFV